MFLKKKLLFLAGLLTLSFVNLNAQMQFSPGPQWLRTAVFYQLYPQSFKDTNNDGIGDLNGISEKLDYLKDLGIDAIWLNPIFESPFFDAGYDVTNFYKIAPRYGNELTTNFKFFYKLH